MNHIKTSITFLFFILLLSSCKKVREYPIKIVNETGYQIDEIVIKGASTYKYFIKKDGETKESVIEWKGRRKHLDGEHCFTYTINKFSDSDTTYTGSTSCERCITVIDLRQSELNILTLIKYDTDHPGCEDGFEILYKRNS